MSSTLITVPASFSLVLEKDAAMAWELQTQTHRILFHQLTDHTKHRSDETTLAHWMLRVKGFIERRVPVGFTTFDCKAVSKAVASQIVANDCAKAVEHLVFWDGASVFPETMRELLALYLRAGYAAINGRCPVDGNDPIPVTFLEAAINRGKIDAAAALIDLGADLLLVPSAYKTVMNQDGTAKTIHPGDIDSYIDYLQVSLQANFAPVRAAMMQRAISEAKALNSTADSSQAAPYRRRSAL